MDEVLEIAAKLSRAIATSKRFTDLRKAEKAVIEDDPSLKLLAARDEIARKVAEKESKGEPIEVADKRELASAQEAVKMSALLSELSRSQADFQEMLNLVNSKITSALEPEKPAAAEEPAEE
jgi:cell fate (sporulation/competence/biofilm development) regulator YlbF (YheA/YmcA/DUF963 family)